MKQGRAVLWDMDGTLIDSEHIAVEALRRAMAEVGLPVPADLHDRVVGRAADELYAWFVRDFGLSLVPVAWELRKHFHHFRASDRLKGFAPAIDAFRHLEAAGVPQAVVSNSDRTIMDKQLGLVGLTRPGSITVARNDVRRGKPDPEGYLRAAWLLDVAPADCIVVEDSPSGAAAGLAAGMVTLFVPHATARAPDGTHRLGDMSDLAGWVKALGA
jgi:HAD superfamily hydrolase (TIGR01509 family)